MRLIYRVLSMAALASFAGAVTVPGADTPLFYLVASSSDQGANLLPLRIIGGAGGYATLTGSGPIGRFYFSQGQLTAQDPTGNGYTCRALIGGIPMSSGCSTYGQLGFSQGSSTGQCTMYNSFDIQPNAERSQLGAQLVFNFVGDFYACGSGQDVWYKVAPADGESNCSAINLWTVPV